MILEFENKGKDPNVLSKHLSDNGFIIKDFKHNTHYDDIQKIETVATKITINCNDSDAENITAIVNDYMDGNLIIEYP